VKPSSISSSILATASGAVANHMLVNAIYMKLLLLLPLPPPLLLLSLALSPIIEAHIRSRQLL